MQRLFANGRLTADAVVRTVKDNRVAINFTLAVRRRFKKADGSDADFFDCTMYRSGTPDSDHIKRMTAGLTKGQPIAIVGTVDLDVFTGRDGATRARLRAEVDDFEYVVGRNQNGDGAAQGGEAVPPATSTAVPETDSDGFMNVPDDIDEELPFM